MEVVPIITGTTGMVGKAVLLECIEHPNVKQIISINRSTLDIKHPKILEVQLNDFKKIDSIKKELPHFNACFHCMGVSSFGLSEQKFNELTFDITKSIVDLVYELNPKAIFNYVSGSGTDSTESGKIMWARVKGKTENYILNKGFKDAYMFRAGAIIPQKGIKSKTRLYNLAYLFLTPFFPLLTKNKNIITSSVLGKAMINSTMNTIENKHLENIDINLMAKSS